MNELMNELIKEVAEAMGWSEDQAQNFMGHFEAPDPETLRTDLMAACEWAQKIEKEAALIDVMKTMPARSMTARWNGGDMTIGLSPERAAKE